METSEGALYKDPPRVVTQGEVTLILAQLATDCHCEDNVDAEQEYDGSWRGTFSVCTSCKAAAIIRNLYQPQLAPMPSVTLMTEFDQ